MRPRSPISNPRAKLKRRLGRILLYLAVCLFASWILLPIWFTLSSSVSLGSEIATGQMGWVPTSPTIANFRDLLLGESTTQKAAGVVETGLRVPKGLGWSAAVSLVLVATNLVFGGLAGYGLSKYRFRGSETVFAFVLVSRIIPALVLVVPFFVAFRLVGIIGTPWALLASYHVFTLPLAILLMKNYFDALPPEMEEATLVDGGTRMQAFWYTAIPLARPGIIAAGLLVFLEAWGEFFFALVFTNQLTLPPILAGLQSLQQFSWPTLAAGLVLAMAPPVSVALLFQRYIVRGLAEGAIK